MASQSTYELVSGIPYGSNARHRMDVFVPRGAVPATGWPTVVFFYGGSWRSGNRAEYRFVGEALAARGVLTILADYRLYPEVRYPEFLVDAAHAVTFTLRHLGQWGGDGSRVFAMGHSAGAYMAAMLALDGRWLGEEGYRPDALAGWIGLAGPYDFLPTENLDVQPVFFHPDYPLNAQPIEFTSTRGPRTFLAAATHDTLVSPDRSTKQLARRLRASGTEVTMKLYEHVSHVTLIGAFSWPLRWMAPVLQDVLSFVDAPPAT